MLDSLKYDELKIFGRKWLWPNLDTIPTFDGKD
jgi:hypothetical protein